ncbi:hypothetical protein AYX22_03960 [Arthrobacter sp. D5-1]|nr:hypothetical protein AYX22_03960 [Arthrobacter sp. D5-1]
MLGVYVTTITLVFAVIFKFIAFTVFGRLIWPYVPLGYSSGTPRGKLQSTLPLTGTTKGTQQ